MASFNNPPIPIETTCSNCGMPLRVSGHLVLEIMPALELWDQCDVTYLVSYSEVEDFRFSMVGAKHPGDATLTAQRSYVEEIDFAARTARVAVEYAYAHQS